MTDWLIFSKDRPMQLDALITSAREWRAPGRSVSVLYRSTFTEAHEGYRRLREEHPGILWKEDGDFCTDVTAFLMFVPGPVGFLTDDSLWIGPADVPPILPYSYRLGRNTVKAWHGEQTAPDELTFEWHGKPGDYGYPLSLDGVVYQKAWILDLLDFTFKNPTELEAGLAARADKLEPQTLTMAGRNSLVTFAHNRVSDSSGCGYSGLPGHDVHTLAGRYLAGDRIRPDLMPLHDVDFASTMEVPYAIA